MSKKRSVLSVFLSELFAAGVFSMMFFIFASRFASPNFEMTHLDFAYIIGAGYLVAVFVSSYHFSAHILPIYSIVEAVIKSNPKIVLVRVPAQIIGTIIALLVFNGLQSAILVQGTMEGLIGFKQYQLNDPYLLIFIQGGLILTMSYLYHIVKNIFGLRKFTGGLLLGLLLTTIFAVTGQIEGIFIANPFGYLFYTIFNTDYLSNPLQAEDWKNLIVVVLLFALVPLLVKLRSLEMLRSKNEINEYDI
ncbi:hypothetical protein [Halocola ammonii]